MRRLALLHLAPVGDRAHEWIEFHGYAYHLRRRLTAEEEQAVGPAIDLRGTDEGRARLEAALTILPNRLHAWAREEFPRPV